MINTTKRAALLATANLAGLVMGLSACVRPLDTPGSSHLQARVDTLEHRKSLLEDGNAIKRLQAAYGYYLDRGQWDQAADLFAADATIEIGLDGVYVGQNRVRQYLQALGGTRGGLASGQLNEHIQLMPYVTVAADGMSARATWRDVILAGKLGQGATWGEGPYENEYIKERGVWKIKSLHWFQTLVVPYEGGWAKSEDVNGGKYVSNRLPPDRPSTVQYRTWPGGLLPPFHFDQPDSIESPRSLPRAAAGAAESAEKLGKRLAVLAQEVQLLRDQHEIENLQRIYGYYIDKGMWTQAASLFTDDGEYEFEGRGAFVGKARVLQYLRAIGAEFPQAGRLYDQMQLQQIVHVSPDGKTAKARWLIFIQASKSGQFAEWGLGVTENDYVRDGDVWKIRKLHFSPTMFTPYDQGWGKTVNMTSSFEPTLAPDRPAPPVKPNFENPVTGPAVYARKPADFAAKLVGAADIEALEKVADAIEHRIDRLEDVAQLENLQMRYGYYLATLEWDRLANLFAPDGTIEIALRGVYVGHDSVRRNLNLYGEPGVHEGNLHNHMQYQPVIHVADDGQTAQVRARAFSMMGNYGKAGLWMGGIYENQFVKDNGVWKFKHDQVFNTYFTPYEQGWKDLGPRPAPGISATNPPDRPPTVQFEMFPKPTNWPPFHYDNPVTHQPASIQ